MDKKRRNRKYKLHYLIRKEGYNLVTRQRTIFVPYGTTEFSKNVNRLRNEFDYAVQAYINDK